jgi:protein CWC15
LQLLCSDDDDDDDDTEALMAELERIKKERAEDKLRKVCVFFSL